MKDGTVRRSIQEQGGGAVAAAGERQCGRIGEPPRSVSSKGFRTAGHNTSRQFKFVDLSLAGLPSNCRNTGGEGNSSKHS